MVILEINCPGELKPKVESVQGAVVEATQDGVEGFSIVKNPPEMQAYPGLACMNASACSNYDCPFHGAILWSNETSVWPEVGDPELKLNPQGEEYEDDEDDEEDDEDDDDYDPYEDDDDDGWEVDDEQSGSVLEEIVSTATGLFGEEVVERVKKVVKEEVGDGVERVVRSAVKGTVEKIIGPAPPEEKKKEEKKPEPRIDTGGDDDDDSFGIQIS